MTHKLISLKEFALRIGVSYSTVRRMVNAKAVQVVTPHRRPMIPESEVVRHTSARENVMRGGEFADEIGR